MALTEQDLDEFIQITKRVYGVVLPRDEARLRAVRLLECLDRLSRPLSKRQTPTLHSKEESR